MEYVEQPAPEHCMLCWIIIYSSFFQWVSCSQGYFRLQAEQSHFLCHDVQTSHNGNSTHAIFWEVQGPVSEVLWTNIFKCLLLLVFEQKLFKSILLNRAVVNFGWESIMCWRISSAVALLRPSLAVTRTVCGRLQYLFLIKMLSFVT